MTSGKLIKYLFFKKKKKQQTEFQLLRCMLWEFRPPERGHMYEALSKIHQELCMNIEYQSSYEYKYYQTWEGGIIKLLEACLNIHCL